MNVNQILDSLSTWDRGGFGWHLLLVSVPSWDFLSMQPYPLIAM